MTTWAYSASMRPDPARFAICFWLKGDPPELAAPGELERLTSATLFQRVVRLGLRSGPYVEVFRGGERYLLHTSCVRPVGDVRFEVGDSVLYKGMPARVRDVIWHFKDERPNYYVTQGRKAVSKRLLDADLEPAVG